MSESRPFESVTALYSRIMSVYSTLQLNEILEAFDGHPKLGDMKKATVLEHSGKEQALVESASDAVRRELALVNEQYQRKFGFRFILSAKGRSSEFMIATCRQRMRNDVAAEIANGAREELAIVLKRVEKAVLEFTPTSQKL